ncbi:uncharacterized protein JCM6883_001684 [Sporobolomyces salmoneus]|uniref:uncharacterized protein n=1 Tax=Sporobolomyces salmoneus TaxID=183962 RepID=UPI00317D8A70
MRDKTLVNGIIRSLVTERTRLSGSTLDLIGSSTRLGPQFAPLLPLYLPTLLRLLCRTNKLYISRSTTTIISILKNTKLVDVLRFIVSEWHGESGKSATFKEKAAEVTAYMLSPGSGGEMQFEKEILDRRIDELEWIIKTAAVDRDAKVRTEAKKCWEVYKREWPDRVASFVSPMTPTIRRYLNVNASAPTASSTSNGSRSQPPVAKKPRVPSALSSSVSQPPAHTTSVPAPSRTATALSRSVGPASRPLPSSTSHRPLPSHPIPSAASSSSDTLNRSTTNSQTSAGMGPPPRTARSESSRSASNSASSRPASRNDEARKELSSSTASHASTRAPSATSVSTNSSASSSFRPTPATRSAPPFKPSTHTTAKPGAAVVEPRRARRIAQDPPPVSAPPASIPPSSSTSTLSRSTSSSTLRSQQALSSSTSSRPHPPTSSAPFRPHKPTNPSLASKTSTRAQPPPAPSTSSRSTVPSRPPVVSSTASSNARTTDKPAPSTSTVRSRRERERSEQEKADKEKEKEKERKAAAIELANLEAAASKKKEQEREESEAEERRLRETAEKAKEIPLPVEEDGIDSEEEMEEEVHQANHGIVESQESVAEEVGMESEYVIESQESDAPRNEEIVVEPVIEEESDPIIAESPTEQNPESLETVKEGTSEEVTEEEVDIVEDAMEQESDDNEDEPESPVIEEIRLVGDLPPSPFMQNVGNRLHHAESEAQETAVEQEEEENSHEDQDVSTESVVTIAPSSHTKPQATASPLPDVSVALDKLALTSDSTESSLLADTTLPRSPLLASAPPETSFSASTPIAQDTNDDFFPTPVQQPVFAALPPLSPEPCQTASIVLETPPRFDDPPAQLRLPGCPVIALNFPGPAPIVSEALESMQAAKEEEGPSQITRSEAGETRVMNQRSVVESSEEEEEEEEDSDLPSPSRPPTKNLSRRAIPPPTPLRSVSRQRQPVFFPEAASFTDIETSFEEGATEDEEEELEASRSYQVPLNDAEYDDSDLGETEGGEKNDVREEEVEEDQGTPKAPSKVESATPPKLSQEVYGFTSRPRESEQEVEDLEDDEGDSRFELEQPELRFHDETESEPEVTMDEVIVVSDEEEVIVISSDEEEEGEGEGEGEEEAIEQQPNILKRSLRSRVVTVDLQTSSAKTPGRNRSREVLGELQ